MKTIQKKIIAIAIMFVMALTTIFYGFTFLPKTAKADEDLSSVDLGKYDSYTDTDEHGTDGSTEDVSTFDEVYDQGINLHDGSDLGEDYEAMYVYAEVEKDNPIVDFVPKELFQTEGKTFYIGKEYGFIVDTFHLEYSNELHSIVMLFDIEINDELQETYDHLSDINNEVVNTYEIAQLNATIQTKRKDKKVYDYFSDSRFISLCKIAETININYIEDCNNAGIKGYLQNKFDYLTLEYKLSNIAQAKNYVRHLQNINCFFSDRQLDYLPVQEFTEDELDYLAVDEHIRWVNEKVEMGWKYGTEYKDRVEREQKRIHKDIIPYADLTLKEKKKDYFPINNMVKNLDKYGIKIYRMDIENKPKLILGCTGHRDLSRIEGFDEEEIRAKVRTYFRELKEKYKLTLYSGFADGADLLFAEEATKCGIDVLRYYRVLGRLL